MTGLLLAATEDRAASPIALVVILFLAAALVLLIRSMNKHLRKVRTGFPAEPPGTGPERDGEPQDGA